MELSTDVELKTRLQVLENQLEGAMGMLKALNHGLRLAIATHTQPGVLLLALENSSRGILHAQAEEADVPRGPTYYAAVHQGIALVRQEIIESGRAKACPKD